LGITAALLVFWSATTNSRIISVILGIIWLWTGIVFSIIAFGRVYPLAYVFGAVFVVQGLAFLYAGWRKAITFGFRMDAYGIVGLTLVLLALIGYPIVGYLAGHRFPEMAIIGAPCPATVLTYGLLLMTTPRVPWPLLIIPFIWAVSGVMPISVGIVEDVILLVGGLLATVMIVYRDRRRVPAEPGIRPAH
jgi:hypothetical protein